MRVVYESHSAHPSHRQFKKAQACPARALIAWLYRTRRPRNAVSTSRKLIIAWKLQSGVQRGFPQRKLDISIPNSSRTLRNISSIWWRFPFGENFDNFASTAPWASAAREFRRSSCLPLFFSSCLRPYAQGYLEKNAMHSMKWQKTPHIHSKRYWTTLERERISVAFRVSSQDFHSIAQLAERLTKPAV